MERHYVNKIDRFCTFGQNVRILAKMHTFCAFWESVFTETGLWPSKVFLSKDNKFLHGKNSTLKFVINMTLPSKHLNKLNG